MKIIDKTPLLDEKGNLGFVQRVQGMLQFGLNWPNELQAQNAIVKFFERQLEKGYTLIRNMPLGESGIIVPIILLGPTGIFVIEVSSLKGRYEAKGDAWNQEAGNGYKPAPINLIQRTTRMARALQAYIERQGVKIPVTIEPVLIAGDPGLHIESVRPAIKVMMIDGIKAFVSGLSNGKPVLRAELVLDYTERILNPRAKPEPIAPMPEPEAETEPDAPAAWEQDWHAEPAQFQQQPEPEISRARAIFGASAEAKPFNPNDFDFALAEDDATLQAAPPARRETNPAKPMRRKQPQQKLIMGMTQMQLAIVAVLGLAFICVAAGLVYVVTTF
jgi:hypothetical protein